MIGLSLCGGGSKGSYEQGVWKALRELGIEFDIVTGSSIGAFNGAMITQGQYEECSLLWDKITIHNVMNNGFELEKFNLKQFITHDQFKVFLKHYIKQFRTDITPLKALLNEYLNPELLRNSKIKFGINTTKFPSLKKEEVVINDLSDYDMYHYILATASIFPVFPICYINNKQYIDGGYSDNLPIDFAFKLGATTVIAVDLNHNITHKHFLNNPLVDYIYPKWDLGSILYFEKYTLQRNRILGFYDTLKYFKKYDGIKYTFNKCQKYDNLAKLITNEILKDTIYLNDKKLITLNKELTQIFNYLNKHLHNKANYYDYFIKCLEEIIFIFEYDPCELYSISDLLEEISHTISLIDFSILKIEFNKLKSNSKKRDFIEKNDKQMSIALLLSITLDYELLILLLNSNIEIYLSYILLKKYKNHK